MISSRRGFLLGAGSTLLAAPAIVRVASLMVISAPRLIASAFPTLLTNDIILREALCHLSNSLAITKIYNLNAVRALGYAATQSVALRT